MTRTPPDFTDLPFLPPLYDLPPKVIEVPFMGRIGAGTPRDEIATTGVVIHVPRHWLYPEEKP